MKKLVAIAAVLDFLWAFVIATFGSTLLIAILDHFHIAHAGLAGAGLWIIAFIVAGIQGGVFLFFVGIIIAMILEAIAD